MWHAFSVCNIALCGCKPIDAFLHSEVLLRPDGLIALSSDQRMPDVGPGRKEQVLSLSSCLVPAAFPRQKPRVVTNLVYQLNLGYCFVTKVASNMNVGRVTELVYKVPP